MKFRTLFAAAVALAIPLSAHANGRDHRKPERPSTAGDYCLGEGFKTVGPNIWFVGHGFGTPPAPGQCKPWLGTPAQGSGFTSEVETGTGCTSADGKTFTLGFNLIYLKYPSAVTLPRLVILDLPDQTGRSYFTADEPGSVAPTEGALCSTIKVP
ncbi:MAG TPA: hypothetical protein VMT61_04785 [Candidatus Binataceae bacterium]|nr:hypothetical protein [Candidatus Binataceae bacterium]